MNISAGLRVLMTLEDKTLASENRAQTVFYPSLEGFEGPLDLLLSLVREQQVDIAQISVTALADQFSAFLAQIPPRELQRAAEYLLMAAWLAMLKSRLLLPDQPESDDEDPSLMAERLAKQMQKLQAMQRVAQELKGRPQLGKDFFLMGQSEVLPIQENIEYYADINGLLRAMCGVKNRYTHRKARLKISEIPAVSIEEARLFLMKFLHKAHHWQNLSRVCRNITYKENEITSSEKLMYARSYHASTFMAALEMQREGDLELYQDNLHSPLHFRRK